MAEPRQSPERDAPDDPFHLCGTTIENKYRVASVVGDGGFGVVYRGVHKGFGELIAIKCLKVAAGLDEKAQAALLEQLREEGRILHRLSRATSGIVQALDVGAVTTDAGAWVPYLVLEWLEGETLAELMKARTEPMPIADAVALLEPAARALAVAHAQKIAHRDVKPANLFVTQVGGARTMKVLDFGIAKVLSEHASRTTALEATALGPSAFTPRYGAPEQFNKSRGATGPWTDVFALALILVELTSGRRALEGDDPTQLYIAAADPAFRPTLRARGVDVPDELERVVDRALSIEPKYRFADAGEFWSALTAAAARASGVVVAKEREDEAAASDATLATGVYAEKKRIAVTSEPVLEDAVAPTRPVESLPLARGGAGSTPPKASADATSHSAVASPPKRAKSTLATDDPMAETPNPAWHAPEPKAAPPPPSAAPRSAGARRGGGAAWIGAAVLVIGAGAAGYYALGMHGGAGPRGAASAHAAASARGPAHTQAPVATSSAPVASSDALDASAPDAAAAAPFVPPEDMVLVAPGKLTMGTPGVEVTITRGFYLDRNEVTVRAYQECVDQRRCSVADHVALTPEGDVAMPASASEYARNWTSRCNAVRKAEGDPINCVDFANAESYCRFRGRRLPTEAEWELAARGTSGRAYAWGDGAPDCGAACFAREGACLVKTAQVATCAAGTMPHDRTPEGIYDLAGNVAEWVADGFVSPLPGGEDPKGDPASPLRVVRGASFRDDADKLAATTRTAAAPVTADVTIGFRCALDAPADAAADAGAP